LFLICESGFATEPAEPNITFENTERIHLTSDEVGDGICLRNGPGDEWYILHDNPARLSRWTQSGKFLGSIDLTANSFAGPSDITFGEGLDILILFYRSPEIVRYNRRLSLLPPIVPFADSNQLELLSICGQTDGTMYALNWTDDYLWQIKRDGNAFPFCRYNSECENPTKIRYCNTTEQFILLGENCVLSFDRFGNLGINRKLKDGLNPRQLVIYHNDAWIVGSEIQCRSLPELTVKSAITINDLRSWDLHQPADIMIANDSTVYILPENGHFIQKVRIFQNVGSGK